MQSLLTKVKSIFVKSPKQEMCKCGDSNCVCEEGSCNCEHTHIVTKSDTQTEKVETHMHECACGGDCGCGHSH